MNVSKPGPVLAQNSGGVRHDFADEIFKFADKMYNFLKFLQSLNAYLLLSIYFMASLINVTYRKFWKLGVLHCFCGFLQKKLLEIIDLN